MTCQLQADDVTAGREIRRYEAGEYLDIVVPWDQVVAWRVSCGCGWTGGQLPAYADPVYGFRDCEDTPAERQLEAEWLAHVAPFIALTDIETTSEQLRELEQHLDEAVARARAGGALWSEVGRAAGVTKQGAQQRWGHLLAHPERSGGV